ncbi:MAG: hypothetical protein ABIQ18_03340, partial [Umezawaea sp.]
SGTTLDSAALAALATRIDTRMKEARTVAFHTEVRSFAGPDESGTSADTTITGSWRYTTDVSMTMHVVNQPGGQDREDLDAVVVPRTVYTKKPSYRGWRRTDDGIADDAVGWPAMAVPELLYLKGAKSATSVREVLDGITVTRTDVSPDPVVMGALFHGKRARADLAAIADQQGTISMSVWIDELGLPVKATVLLSGKQAKRSTTRLSDWGRGATITVPQDNELAQE